MPFSIVWLVLLLLTCVNGTHGTGGSSGLSGYNYQGNKKNTYDYIIVGAGTSGSIISSRLAQTNPSKRILLIEEGYYSNANPVIEDGKNWFDLLFDETIERGYTTVPQVHLNNREIWQPQAKVTGGCNSHNAMVYILGNIKDYNERWHEEYGPIDGWTWDDNLSQYWHEINSIFVHTQQDKNNILMQHLINSSIELGYPYNENQNDLNSQLGQFGVSMRQFMAEETLNNSYLVRHTSWTDFMDPFLEEQASCRARNCSRYNNLDILVLTRVNRVLLTENKNDGDSSSEYIAYGVETYNIGNYKTEKYYAKNEIILCGGPFDTPKLLMLSGIGNCDELENVGIECKVNLYGVGKNLQDHTFVEVQSPPLLSDIVDNFDSIYKNYQYDIYPFWGVLAIEQDGEYYHGLSIKKTVDDESGDDIMYISINVEPFHYQFRGNVTLSDSNYDSDPIINPSYLDNEFDKNKILNGVKKAREFLYNTSFIPLLFGGIDEKINEIQPGYDILTDEQLLEWLFDNTVGDFHPGCTCRMGNDFDQDGNVVVNSKLKVKNVDGLRIGDSSVFPEMISGNPNQATMIVALKAVDLINHDNHHYNN